MGRFQRITVAGAVAAVCHPQRPAYFYRGRAEGQTGWIKGGRPGCLPAGSPEWFPWAFHRAEAEQGRTLVSRTSRVAPWARKARLRMCGRTGIRRCKARHRGLLVSLGIRAARAAVDGSGTLCPRLSTASTTQRLTAHENGMVGPANPAKVAKAGRSCFWTLAILAGLAAGRCTGDFRRRPAPGA